MRETQIKYTVTCMFCPCRCSLSLQTPSQKSQYSRKDFSITLLKKHTCTHQSDQQKRRSAERKLSQRKMEKRKKQIRDQLDHYVGLTTEPQDRQLCPPACHTQLPSWFHGGYTRCSSYCPLGGAPERERETHTQTLCINFNQSALQNKHARNESCVTDRLLVLVHRCSTEPQK